MKHTGKARMLTIHLGADDRWEDEPLHEAIVKRARQLDVAGATVHRGILGYGAQGTLHRHKTFALSQDDPITITVIDEEARIDALLAALDEMVGGGCVIAVSEVTQIRYQMRPVEREE